MVGGGSGGGGGAGSQRRQGTLARPARHSARGHSLVQLGPAPGADKEAVLGVKLVELAGSRGLSALGEGGEGGGGGGGEGSGVGHGQQKAKMETCLDATRTACAGVRTGWAPPTPWPTPSMPWAAPAPPTRWPPTPSPSPFGAIHKTEGVGLGGWSSGGGPQLRTSPGRAPGTPHRPAVPTTAPGSQANQPTQPPSLVHSTPSFSCLLRRQQLLPLCVGCGLAQAGRRSRAGHRAHAGWAAGSEGCLGAGGPEGGAAGGCQAGGQRAGHWGARQCVRTEVVCRQGPPFRLHRRAPAAGVR